LVLGDNPSHIFTVKIASSENVSILKEAIWTKKIPEFNHVAADKLVVWKVSISLEEFEAKLANAQSPEHVHGSERLIPVEALSNLFSTLENGHIHIILERPASGKGFNGEYFVTYGESDDRVAEPPSSRIKSVSPSAYKGDPVAKGRAEWATKFPQKAPSNKGKPKNFMSDQRKAVPAFRFNRPPSTDATIPITLYHPIFGEFQEDCKMYIPTREDNDFALKLSLSMSDFYDDEKRRAKKAREEFGEYGLHFLAAEIDGYRTDGDLRWKKFCLALIEMKPELCLGNAEPLFEGAWYYVAFTRDQLQANLGSHLPCLILYAAGECTCIFQLVLQDLKFLSQVLILVLQVLFGPIGHICRS
jgi:hypothetical protein